MVIPEDYKEMEVYLNSLAAWLWKEILRAENIKEVIDILRSTCKELRGWTDEELELFFNEHALNTFNGVDERF